MLLRYIVNLWVHQTARQKVYELVSDVLRGQGGAAARPDSESGDSPTPAPLPPCDVAVLFALDLEAGGFVDQLEQMTSTRCANYFEHDGRMRGRRIVVAETGVGRELAARAAADVIEQHRPTWLISAGFAGALRDEVRRGHVVMASVVADETGAQLATGLKLDAASQPGIHGGRLLTVDRIVRDESEKRRLAAAHDAVACDMETMAIAEACRRQQTRFLSLRIISDAVDDKLPPEVERLLEQKSLAGKLGAAAGAIFNRPSSAKDLWRLHTEALRAADRLAKVLASVIDRLPS